DTVSDVGVDNRRALAWSLGKYIHANLCLLGFKADKRTLGGKAGEARQPLPSAYGLHVLFKYLIDRGAARHGMNVRIVGILDRRGVLCGEVRYDAGLKVTVMAGVTTDGAHTSKVFLIDGVHHRDHPARRLLQRGIIGKLVPGTDAFRDVAVDTVQAQS